MIAWGFKDDWAVVLKYAVAAARAEPELEDVASAFLVDRAGGTNGSVAKAQNPFLRRWRLLAHRRTLS